MEMEREATESRAARFDELYAEAKEAIGYAANTLRSVGERYRAAYRDSLARWQELRDRLDALEGAPAASFDPVDPAAAAEAGASDAVLKALRREVAALTADLGRQKAELSRMELSTRSLERTWLFVGRGDTSLLGETGDADPDVQMQLVQAQEAERTRLAQEIHDGPAQALANAIFQVEYIERVIAEDPSIAVAELGFLRRLLRRELDDVRRFISELRPPLLDELGLDGSIRETAENLAALSGTSVETDLGAPAERLTDAQQTMVLRIVQEALQNVRKHAGASRAVVASRVEDGTWLVEVRDDGHGFDVAAVAARGRRNFGLQFMRERAEMIGARLEVRSRGGGGTIVRLSIPVIEERA